jgi:hypothetical protein
MNTGLTASTRHCYTVVATNAKGKSAPSGQVCTNTLALPPPVPATPGVLSGKAVAEGQIEISWNASTGATAYVLRRRLASEMSNGTVIATVTATVVRQTYCDTGLPKATQYCYTVAAKNDAGESPASDFICVQTFNTCRLASEEVLAKWVALPEATYWAAMIALIEVDNPSFDCQWNMAMVGYRLAAKSASPVLATPEAIQGQVDALLAAYNVDKDTLTLYQTVSVLAIRGRELGRDEKLNLLVRTISNILGQPPSH